MIVSRLTASHRPRNVALSAFAYALLPVLAGCPNLTQVQQLATTADGAKAAASAIAGDFSMSCQRQSRILKDSCDDVQRKVLAQIGTNLAGEQAILFAYFDTLGKLASTDATGFEAAAPKLNTAFANAGLSSNQQAMASAAGSLAADITKLVTLGYREKKIAEILKSANDPVQTLTSGLANQVAPDIPDAYTDHPCDFKTPVGTAPSYLTELCNEDANLTSSYKIALAGTKDPGTVLLVQAQGDIAVDQLQTREAAALAYRKLMLSLGTAHSKLLAASSKGNFNASTVKALANALSGPISDMTSAISTLQKDAR